LSLTTWLFQSESQAIKIKRGETRQTKGQACVQSKSGYVQVASIAVMQQVAGRFVFQFR
jgi:hypothetical protein